MADLAQKIWIDIVDELKKARKKHRTSKKKNDVRSINYYRGQITILSKIKRRWQQAVY